MKSSLARIIVLIATALVLSSCYVYDPYYPYGYPAGPSAFDRTWSAATGAMRDQGMQISAEDRASGVIDGTRGGITVRTRVLTQADGKVRVEFNAGGNLSEDPGLPDRISRSYEARMGR